MTDGLGPAAGLAEKAGPSDGDTAERLLDATERLTRDHAAQPRETVRACSNRGFITDPCHRTRWSPRPYSRELTPPGDGPAGKT